MLYTIATYTYVLSSTWDVSTRFSAAAGCLLLGIKVEELDSDSKTNMSRDRNIVTVKISHYTVK